MKPEPIQMWKAPDGTIYQTEAEAYRHINQQNAKEKLTDIIARKFNWEDDFEPEHYASFLLVHAKEIGDILEDWRGL